MDHAWTEYATSAHHDEHHAELAKLREENDRLRFRAENCEQSTQMRVVERLTAQRDTLLAALKWVLSPYCTRLVDARERIRTAICEVQGEK